MGSPGNEPSPSLCYADSNLSLHHMPQGPSIDSGDKISMAIKDRKGNHQKVGVRGRTAKLPSSALRHVWTTLPGREGAVAPLSHARLPGGCGWDRERGGGHCREKMRRGWGQAGTTASTWHMLLCARHTLLSAALGSSYYSYPHFTDLETEAQRSNKIENRSRSGKNTGALSITFTFPPPCWC